MPSSQPDELRNHTKIDSDDKTTYASMTRGGLMFQLCKDGYPVRIQFNRLDGQQAKRFGRLNPHVVPLEEAERQIDEFESKMIPDFTTWLGHHSKEGWEIFKISREFNSPEQNTWCVFRRKI